MPNQTRREHLLGLLESALAGQGIVVRCTSKAYATKLRWTLYRLKRQLGPQAQGLSFSILPSAGVVCDLAITWSPPGEGIISVQGLEAQHDP